METLPKDGRSEEADLLTQTPIYDKLMHTLRVGHPVFDLDLRDSLIDADSEPGRSTNRPSVLQQNRRTSASVPRHARKDSRR